MTRTHALALSTVAGILAIVAPMPAHAASSPVTVHTVAVAVAPAPVDWQARKRHALHLDRAHRARYVRHLAAHMRPCPMEDSRDCVWHGHTAGNGVGRSFADLAGVTFYFNGQVRRYV